MSKSQPSQPTTSGPLGILLDALIRAAMSKDPRERAAGWIILAGCFVAYAVAGDGVPLL